MKKSTLFLLTGPSAAGKSSTLETLLARNTLPLRHFVTTTTRLPREGEQNGIDYWFVTREEFQKDLERGMFFEHADVYGNLYGSNKRELERLEVQGDPIIFAVNVEGAQAFKKALPTAITIYLDAPREQLKTRLIARGVTPDDLERRLQAMDLEAEYKSEADIVILNDDGDQNKTVDLLEQTIRQNMV